MSDEVTRAIIDVAVRGALTFGVAAAALLSLRKRWWKTPKDCSYAAVAYPVLTCVGVALCWIGTPSGQILTPFCIVTCAVMLAMCIPAFRSEARRVTREIAEEEKDALDEVLSGGTRNA